MRRLPVVGLAAVAAAATCLVAGAARAQGPIYQPPRADTGGLEAPRRAPLTLTPSITVVEEFNDNIFLDNRNRQSDFITSFSPGILLETESPIYRLGASYFFSADIYADHSQFNEAFDRQRFVLDGLYRVDPRTTLTLTDTFALDRNTNLVSEAGIATGRARSWSNALALGASWQADPRTTLRGGVGWTMQRFDTRGLADSDTYRATVAAERALTARLSGALSYEFDFFDVSGSDNTMAHIPRLGLTYRFTPTLTGSVSAGPMISVSEHGDTEVSPAVAASLRQRTSWGAVGASYDRSLGTAGGLGGVTENQTVEAYAELTTLVKALALDARARYSIVESSRGSAIDVKSFTLPVGATYRFTPWFALVGQYIFFTQHSDSQATTTGASLASDVDQNRVWVGVQFGYPIRFE